MAVIRNEPRAPEHTEKRIVEVASDGTILSSEPVDETVHPVTAHPITPQQVVQPAPQVIRVKGGGGNAALMIVSLVLAIALVGAGVYMFQTRDDTVALQQAELQLQQQRTVAEDKLQELGRAADDLSDQVRDTQRDLGIPATPPPAATQSATTAPATTAPATTAPATPAPVQPQTTP